MATLTRGSDFMNDRYRYDFRLCTYANGWAQLDTKQDAPYYGNWVNPTERKLFSYCEGDTVLTECEDDADFVQSVRECCDWHKERDYFIGIDVGRESEMRSRFESLGLGEFLH